MITNINIPFLTQDFNNNDTDHIVIWPALCQMPDLNSLKTFVIESWQDRFLDLFRQEKDVSLHLIIQNHHNYIKKLINNFLIQASPITIWNKFENLRAISIEISNLTWFEIPNLDRIKFLRYQTTMINNLAISFDVSIRRINETQIEKILFSYYLEH